MRFLGPGNKSRGDTEIVAPSRNKLDVVPGLGPGTQDVEVSLR